MTGGAQEDLGLGTAARSAILKVMRAVPEPFRPAATASSQRILVDPAGWMRSPDPMGALGVLQASHGCSGCHGWRPLSLTKSRCGAGTGYRWPGCGRRCDARWRTGRLRGPGRSGRGGFGDRWSILELAFGL